LFNLFSCSNYGIVLWSNLIIIVNIVVCYISPFGENDIFITCEPLVHLPLNSKSVNNDSGYILCSNKNAWWIVWTLTNVRYVLKLKKNLICIESINDKCYRSHVEGEVKYITRMSGFMVIQVTKRRKIIHPSWIIYSRV